MRAIKYPLTSRLLMTATVVASVLCAVLLAACGGGEPAPAVAVSGGSETSDAASPASSAQLEGCVVDQYHVPRSGTAVRGQTGDEAPMISIGSVDVPVVACLQRRRD